MLNSKMAEADIFDFGPEEQPRELNELIALYNDYYGGLPPGSNVSVEEHLRVNESLEGYWPFPEEYVAFSGWCRAYEAFEEPKTRTDYVALQEGVSGGLTLAKFGSEAAGHWAVALVVTQPYEDDDGYLEEDEEEGGAYGRTYLIDTSGPHGFVPYDRVDVAMPEGLDFPDIFRTLSLCSDMLVAGLNDPEFYVAPSRAEQLYFVKASIEQAEEQCKEFDEKIKGAPIAAYALTAYVLTETDGSYHYAPIDIAECNITGVGDGLDSLALRHLRVMAERITRPEHTVDPSAGLCLSIRIDSSTARALNEIPEMPRTFNEDDSILMPLSGQDVDVVFDKRIVEQLARNRF